MDSSFKYSIHGYTEIHRGWKNSARSVVEAKARQCNKNEGILDRIFRSSTRRCI